MSVNSLLRCTIRLERKNVAAHLVLRRALSGAEAVNALRPFYFAVHPDFFGKHPREREVNENSLKRLNGYLENLQQPSSRSVQPLKLTFYVRNTVESKHDVFTSGFRSVSLILHSRDVLSTVKNVLKSCNLPVEHMEQKTPSKRPAEGDSLFYRPIKWDKSYYAFTGFRDPEEELQQANRVEPTLDLWLRKNEPDATTKLSASLPLRAELKRLKKELCSKFNITDIRWQRTWGVAHRCCQLRSLSRLSQQSPESMINLHGHTVVFADHSGMNSSGGVMLGTTDVHHQWAKVFQNLHVYRSLQQQSEWLKERVSLLLGGAQVVQLELLGLIQPIQEHYSALNTFHKGLMSGRLRLHPRSLSGISVTLENESSSCRLHESGRIIVPVHCDTLLLQAFLLKHATQARLKTQHQRQLQVVEEALVKECVQSLSLRGLSKEPSISSGHMVQCCRRLLDLHQPPLQGLHVCVSHFYSVMQDGDLCVPWDWRS